MTFREEILADGVTLYLGDCREVVPSLKIDLALTDPPYNIGFRYGSHTDNMSNAEYIGLLEILRGSDCAILQYPEETMRFVVPALGVPDDCIAWCYNSNLPRQFRLWSIYGRSPDFSAVRQPSKNAVAKVISDTSRSYDWFADIQQVKGNALEKTAHPCQAPLALFSRMLGLLGRVGETIVDPFIGSGTCGVAAVQAGYSFVGIEKDPGYFDIACERISEAIRQADLFITPPKLAKQMRFLEGDQ